MANGGLDAGDSFSPRGWVADLSYAEIHAFGIGATILFLAAFANSPHLLAAGVAIALWAFRLIRLPFRGRLASRSTESGENAARDDPDEPEGEPQPETRIGPTRKLSRQIKNEVHYYVLGGVVGDRLGWVAYRWVHGAGPDHYAELPELVRWLFVM